MLHNPACGYRHGICSLICGLVWRGSLDRGVEKKLFYSLSVFGSPTLKYSGSWLIILLSQTYYGSWLINTFTQ